MPVEIKAGEVKLDSVFSDAYSFDIPLYQRPYSWDVQHVETLLDDLNAAMERSDPKEPTPYFLGSIVIVKEEHYPQSEVVDGQQRLTTLTMLLCVLRDITNKAGNSARADALNTRIYKVADEFSETSDRFRLNLRSRDRNFFQSNVQMMDSVEGFLSNGSGGLEDARERIFKNVEYLYQKLIKWDEQARRDLAAYILRQCYLVVVSTSDEESAHRVFLVLNDRGLDLSHTDRLKADVISLIPESSQGDYNRQWEDIEAEDRDEFGRLFVHIRTIYRKEKQQDTLTKEFRDHVLKLKDLTPEGAMSFVDDVLVPYAEVYNDIAKAQCESTAVDNKVNVLLSHLGRLDNFDWIPPTMAYFHRNRGNAESILSFAELLERLAYGMFIQRVNINGRIRRYAQILNLIEQGGELLNANSPLQLADSEKRDILQRLDGNIYNQPTIPTPLLMRLNSILADPSEGITYQRSGISIEHVLPQTPASGSQWFDWFPNEEERQKWTHRLANLVLLSRRKNPRASNYEFAVKKSEYFQKSPTTFALTTQVISETEWTPAVLERRQQELINAFKKEWQLD